MDNKKLLNYLLLFLSLTLILQVFFTSPTPTPSETNSDKFLEFQATKDSYGLGKTVGLKIKNTSPYTLVFQNKCPDSMFQVVYLNNGQELEKTATNSIDCQSTPDASVKDFKIQPGKSKTYNYTFWSNSLFSETGQYKISADLKIKDESIHVESPVFQIKERGLITKIWTSSFYQPIYNFFILLLSFMPNENLGLAIILLTLILRGLLYVPSKKAIHSQKRMAEIQPQLNAIKEKYKDNQQMIAGETMKIWKENNVSPASSCLPMLIQFPILISLFYVIQNVLNPDKAYLLYGFLKDFDLSQVSTLFLGFDLRMRSLYVLPIIVGGLQYFQLSQMQSKKPKEEKKKPKDQKKPEGPDPQDMQNMMQYFMPVMIAVFTSSMPAGIGLYWGSSTLFSIAQQTFMKDEDNNDSKSKSSKVPKREKINPKKITTIKI